MPGFEIGSTRIIKLILGLGREADHVMHQPPGPDLTCHDKSVNH
jgi:hypothetical protein